MKNTHLLGLILLVMVALTSCQKDWRNEILPGKKLFVSAAPRGYFTKDALQAAAVKSGYGVFAPLAKYDVDFYKIVYYTTFKGKQIQVSGLLGIPQGVPTAPSLLSAQHGTMFRYADAPSNFPLTFTGFELFASAGYITLIPDFIGYGVSQNTVHPYYDQQSSGLTVTDMIKAVKYYLQDQNKPASNRLFLVGYSEGGYVTMAAQKEIETTPAHQLKVTAAAEGAGGYDLNVILNTLADTSYYAAPSFLTLLIKGYNATYNWNRPYSDFFQQPYASQIPSLLDGTKGREQIDAALTTSPAGLFNPVFYAGLNNPTQELALKLFLAGNSFLTWAPRSPTRLFHGTADEAVFFKSSVTTYARFKALGAPDVEFYPISNGTHATSIAPMMLLTLPWIQSLDH
ncbi:MAG: prolyl oligopeptidase family serine peptidase [Williamsia sp.]|nr:prolyl oligopeptidase family serine peptidase [Williamsia sp.]